MPSCNYVEECLSVLAEECAEVIQVVHKIDRFGMDSYHPNDPSKNNLDLLHGELGDLLCMVDLLVEEGVLDPMRIQNAKLFKRVKFAKYRRFHPAPREASKNICGE